MELQKLRYFYTVAKFGHMTHAAEALRIAQPALTQAIKSLESEFGVPLFERRGRNIALTEYGVFLQARLETILPELDALPGELSQLKNRVNKTVRMSILAASPLIIDLVVRYRHENPDVIFDFEKRAKAHGADIVITTDGVSSAHHVSATERHIKTERIFLAVPRNSVWATRQSVALTEMAQEEFVMLSGSRPFGVTCNRFCSMAGFVPRVLFESDSLAAVQNIIGTGTGVAFWPEFSWCGMENPDVVLLPISSPYCQRDLIVEHYERPAQSPYALDFYRFLTENI